MNDSTAHSGAPKVRAPEQTHLKSPSERLAIGKALREQASRKAQGEFRPSEHRADPIELLIENSKGRVEELVPIRYGRMMVNPFAFYRGAAAIMAYDLSTTPKTGVNVMACGDAHLVNFGGFATTERRLIFDINDFDETSIAPWEWDVKRLVASFVVAGQSNGFNAVDCREAAWLAAQSYRQAMASYAETSVLDAWYDAMDLGVIINSMPDKEMKRFYTKKLASAEAQSAHEKEFARLAHTGGYPARIIDQPPLIYHFGDLRDEEFTQRIHQALKSYFKSLPLERQLLVRRYNVVDVAMKVVGVGSVGTRCGIALMMSGSGEPLFLQFKEARQSVLEPYAGKGLFDHHGQRVVIGQRLMQAASDMFLGWGEGAGGGHFYMRQLRDAKIKPVIEIMKPFNLKGYAGLCGRALARAHTRSGDAVVLSGYMGKSTAFEDALANFAVAYAAQNEEDHAALVDAVRAGRITAQMVE
ncbi:MAG: DUF2252 domain-containing protein [Caldilineales bacterium]|nr:DUF2252 domain-containing protein [Caldilineales bacterium]